MIKDRASATGEAVPVEWPIRLNLNMLLDPATALARGEPLFLGELSEAVTSAMAQTDEIKLDRAVFRETQEAVNFEFTDLFGLIILLESLAYDHSALNTPDKENRAIYATIQAMVKTAERVEHLQNEAWDAVMKPRAS